jgi:signal-transduction protein with cAMP-binding, CBS, and nucleotidyltransferase domain
MMAARHMHSHHVNAVLVTEVDGTLVGIFTERDAISRVLADGKDPLATILADVMTDNPDTVSPQDSTEEVLRRMRAAQCRHLPIAQDGKVMGMVSLGQLCPKIPAKDCQKDTTSITVIGFGAANDWR